LQRDRALFGETSPAHVGKANPIRFTLVIAIGFVLINLLVDLSYAFLDPRVRLR
jgi:hypothetical protein